MSTQAPTSAKPSEKGHAPSTARPTPEWSALYRGAHALLCSGRSKPPTDWGLLCQIYARLGLIDAAQELLDLGHVADLAVRTRLQGLLSRNPDRRLAWNTYRSRYLRNRGLLFERYPEIQHWLDPWEGQCEQFVLYRLADGNFQVAQLQPDRPRSWWPGLADHRGEQLQRPFSHAAQALMPAPYLFHGLGFGWFVQRLFKATKNTFLTFSPAIYFVESDPLSLAISLHLHDWQELIGDPRIYFFFGQDATREIQLLWLQEDGLPLPSVCVHNSLTPGASSQSLVATVNQASDRRARLQRRLVRRAEATYATHNVDYWAERFTSAINGRGDPLRILCPVSRQTTYLQYSIRDAAEAFTTLGHDCRILTENCDHQVVSTNDLQRAIADGKIDLLFIMDHLRSSSIKSIPLRLPLFTWDQDVLPNVMTRQNIAAMGPLDLIGGASKLYYTQYLGCEPSRVCTAIIPTHPKAFSSEPVDAADLRRYGCDVSYVSNASQTPLDFHEEEWRRLDDPRGRTIINRMYEITCQAVAEGRNVLGTAGHWILSRAEELMGIAVKDAGLRDRLLNWYLWRLADRFYRHQALEWVGRWAERSGRTFHLYGRGWEQHETFRSFARGPAQNGYELRCIYQASTINLQLMPAGFLHQRALDGLAAGGFFLTRHTHADHLGGKAARILKRYSSCCESPSTEATHELHSLLTDYETCSGVRHDPNKPLDHFKLQCAAEHETAGTVFPEFERIEFESENGFVEKVERYLAQMNARREIAGLMRKIVLERYTYEKTMNRFLHFAKDYYVKLAERPT